jgi:hypothetical protein
MRKHFEEAKQVKRTKLERDKEINHITDLIENKLHVVMDTYEIDLEIYPPGYCNVCFTYHDMSCVFSAIEIVRSSGFTVSEPKVIDSTSLEKSVSITIKW